VNSTPTDDRPEAVKRVGEWFRTPAVDRDEERETRVSVRSLERDAAGPTKQIVDAARA
jgi:hypothetical protein